MTDRLTIAAARPGMRVVCVNDKCGRWKLRAGDEYVISSVNESGGWVEVEGSKYVHAVDQFILASDPPTLAALLAERAPGLLAQMRGVYDLYQHASFGMLWADGIVREIERAGLIAQEPRTPFHLTPQQFQEMWNVG